jgi:hypothetical protein
VIVIVPVTQLITFPIAGKIFAKWLSSWKGGLVRVFFVMLQADLRGPAIFLTKALGGDRQLWVEVSVKPVCFQTSKLLAFDWRTFSPNKSLILLKQFRHYFLYK